MKSYNNTQRKHIKSVNTRKALTLDIRNTNTPRLIGSRIPSGLVTYPPITSDHGFVAACAIKDRRYSTGVNASYENLLSPNLFMKKKAILYSQKYLRSIEIITSKCRKIDTIDLHTLKRISSVTKLWVRGMNYGRLDSYNFKLCLKSCKRIKIVKLENMPSYKVRTLLNLFKSQLMHAKFQLIDNVYWNRDPFSLDLSMAIIKQQLRQAYSVRKNCLNLNLIGVSEVVLSQILEVIPLIKSYFIIIVNVWLDRYLNLPRSFISTLINASHCIKGLTIAELGIFGKKYNSAFMKQVLCIKDLSSLSIYHENGATKKLPKFSKEHNFTKIKNVEMFSFPVAQVINCLRCFIDIYKLHTLDLFLRFDLKKLRDNPNFESITGLADVLKDMYNLKNLYIKSQRMINGSSVWISIYKIKGLRELSLRDILPRDNNIISEAGQVELTGLRNFRFHVRELQADELRHYRSFIKSYLSHIPQIYSLDINLGYDDIKNRTGPPLPYTMIELLSACELNCLKIEEISLRISTNELQELISKLIYSKHYLPFLKLVRLGLTTRIDCHEFETLKSMGLFAHDGAVYSRCFGFSARIRNSRIIVKQLC